MADLFPTKTRLDLLEAVRDGLVLTHPMDEEIYPLQDPDPPHCVTERMRQMYRAKWVEPQEESGSLAWELTDAGRETLEEADRG